MLIYFLISLVKVLIVFTVILLIVAYMTLMERKVLGRMQVRFGPNRVGPFGLLQPVADGIKLFFKEDIIVPHANRVIYILAPGVLVTTALVSYAVIPFGDSIKILGQSIDLVVADVNVGLLYLFAVSSLGVYGVVMGGWASNNKYSLLGAIRSSAQMISYELSLGLSIVGVLMIVGSLSLNKIVEAQAPVWFILYQPLGFIIYLISAVAECSRTPFDLTECENELVAGYQTEYSSMKFALYYLAEYIHILVVSSLAVSLFFGGWQGPFLPPVIWFLIKVFIFIFFFIWIRATFPRFRYDQLMKFGWKVLFPLALGNILLTAVGIILFSK
ncbi:MAG: NADH-quinone oxidoreductase subunit NuoH [Deltaproteobacteria bacterium]|jgi:NADH-quinone oxidoreductase subunit H|nr:NADH-quinone oxidoreductase subunit NuoH [Deltaproteobacteria bacterium]